MTEMQNYAQLMEVSGMKRYSGLLLVLVLLVVPSFASAQKKPGNNKDTRSAEVYLEGAKKEQVVADKAKFFQQALEATQRGAQTDPDNARVWLLMGRAYVGLNNLQGADSAFDKAEQLYPGYATETAPYRQNAWIQLYNAGIQAIQQGDVDKAIVELESANNMFQGRPEALTTLAQLYLQKQDAVKAEKAFRDALVILRGPARQGLAPDQEKKWAANESESVFRLAGLLADLKRYDEAQKLYEEFLQRQPDNALAKANMGVVMMRAGKAAAAAPIFNELLARPELEGSTLFNIGVGLFRAEQYEPAARAFERALTENPYSRDGLYNLGQAVYAYTVELEKAKEGKTGAELAKINESLGAQYERMGSVAQKLLDVDPANGNIIMMLAQSQRGRSEIAADKAKSDEWKKAVLATLEKHDALQVEVTQLQVVPAQGKFTVMGMVKNVKAAQDAPIKINVALLDKNGASVGEGTTSVNAPATGETVRFTLEITAPETAVAWKYAIVK